MRMAYLACCVVVGGLVGANLATAERQLEPRASEETAASLPQVATGGGALNCPLWPIDYYGGNIYLFYTEYYDNYECLNPRAAIYIGYAPDWPYICPDCLLSSFRAEETSRDGDGSRTFTGLEGKVSADFRPHFPDVLHANDGVSFSGEQFVEFTPPGAQAARRFKLFRVHLERAAAGRSKSAARTIGLGYEVATEPATAPTLDVTNSTVTPTNGSSHAYTLRVGAQDYVLLLSK